MMMHDVAAVNKMHIVISMNVVDRFTYGIR